MRTATPDEGLRSELQAALAQKFPRAISFRTAFSSSASATSRFRVAFSRSRSFKRFASSAFRPANWLRHR
jgi:hypothetical protein